MILPWSIITRITWSNLHTFFSSNRNSRSTPHFVCILNTTITTRRSHLALPIVFLPTCSTSRSTTLRTTTFLKFDIRIFRFILILNNLLYPKLVLIIWSTPHKISRNPTKLTLVNRLSIYHESNKVHVIMEHGRTTLFIEKSGNTHHKLII